MSLLLVVVSSHFIVNNILEVSSPDSLSLPKNIRLITATSRTGYDLVLDPRISRYYE
jgi:hypothetical protein